MELSKKSFLKELEALVKENYKVKLIMSNGWAKVPPFQKNLILKELNVTMGENGKFYRDEDEPIAYTNQIQSTDIRNRQLEELLLVYEGMSKDEILNLLVSERHRQHNVEIMRKKGSDYRGHGACSVCKKDGMLWVKKNEKVCRKCRRK